ncbi:MAG: sulfurtransferase [Gammaproteobacteria bacterium]|nr:MAG: sulfurtransferase [Gammaproteobacteria bacterium]
MKNEHQPLLIDVRTEGEYADGHLPGAINIPHKELEQRLAELPTAKNNHIVLYCRSGTRAGIAKKILAKNGFTKLDHLSGDYIAWSKKGLPLVKSKAKKGKKISNPCAL